VYKRQDDDLAPPVIGNNAPDIFPAGATTVTFRATDLTGNVGMATAIVQVNGARSTINIAMPPAVTAEATTPNGSPRTNSDVAAYLQSPIVTDTASVATLSNNAPPILPFGTTAITWTARDALGHVWRVTGGIVVNGVTLGTITVVDRTPPAITVPPATGVEAASGAGTPATNAIIQAFLGGARAVDLVDPNPTLTWARCVDGTTACLATDQPTTFPLGVWPIRFTASDHNQPTPNVSTAFSYLSIRDTTPPTLTVPVPITLEDTEPGGITLAKSTTIQQWLASATATDAVDPKPVLTNDAPAFFQLGTTTVHFTAVDFSQNVRVLTSTVTVVDTTPPAVSITAPTKDCLLYTSPSPRD